MATILLPFPEDVPDIIPDIVPEDVPDEGALFFGGTGVTEGVAVGFFLTAEVGVGTGFFGTSPEEVIAPVIRAGAVVGEGNEVGTVVTAGAEDGKITGACCKSNAAALFIVTVKSDVAAISVFCTRLFAEIGPDDEKTGRLKKTAMADKINKSGAFFNVTEIHVVLIWVSSCIAFHC